MEGHAKKCVERYCELANKTTQQLCKVSTLCIDDHHFNEEELKSVGEVSQVCSQIVLKCLYLARIGIWSVNKFARSITILTKACDKRLSRLISFIIHVITNKIVMWETLQNNVGWDCFKTPILQEIWRTQNPLLEEHYVFPNSWICKKQTSVSHSSTESDIISLDAGLRLDGVPALDSWDLIVTVLHGNTHPNDQVRRDPHKSPMRKKIHGKMDDLDNVDFYFLKREFFT